CRLVLSRRLAGRSCPSTRWSRTHPPCEIRLVSPREPMRPSESRSEEARRLRRDRQGTLLSRVAVVAYRKNRKSERHPPTGRTDRPDSPPPARVPLRTESTCRLGTG